MCVSENRSGAIVELNNKKSKKIKKNNCCHFISHLFSTVGISHFCNCYKETADFASWLQKLFGTVISNPRWKCKSPEIINIQLNVLLYLTNPVHSIIGFPKLVPEMQS